MHFPFRRYRRDLCAIGGRAILRLPLIAFFCSNHYPGDIILKSYDLARVMRDAGVPVIAAHPTATPTAEPAGMPAAADTATPAPPPTATPQPTAVVPTSTPEDDADEYDGDTLGLIRTETIIAVTTIGGGLTISTLAALWFLFIKRRTSDEESEGA